MQLMFCRSVGPIYIWLCVFSAYEDAHAQQNEHIPNSNVLPSDNNELPCDNIELPPAYGLSWSSPSAPTLSNYGAK